MKIYTRTGDGGETSLFGGQRVRKTTARIRAYGTVDELNASLGVAIASGEPDELAETLRQLQQELFMVGADLATPSGTKESRTVRVSDEHIRRLESEIDRHDETLEPLKNFILPGGTERAAALHLARTICRRAEREIIELAEQEKINERVIVYLNRFSDLLFVLARTANARAGENDIPWRPERGSTSLPGET
jgi:cob(I)alamin adenosyltransferase